MKVNELNPIQKSILKQAILLEMGDSTFAQLCDCNQIVTDAQLEARWGDTEIPDWVFA